jgi:hypothetical protein
MFVPEAQLRFHVKHCDGTKGIALAAESAANCTIST